MPLLVNAMQENSYVDPTIELPISNNYKTGKLLNPNSNHEYLYDNKYKPIRRTSPRPFIFEYRSPTPTPFSNTPNYNSRNWIESYRNAQRLKNMEQVLKYLERTINAKFADLYTYPSNTQIAFSGVYVQPTKIDVKPESSTTTTTPSSITDINPQASNVIVRRRPIYAADPLFTFKPESPGDVNLLADQSLRFSPNPIQNLQKNNKDEDKKTFKVPMFRPIPQFKRSCLGTRCGLQSDLDKKILQALQGSFESEKVIERPKSFSLMLNLFPLQQKRQDIFPNSHLDNIYFTTLRPKLHFRPKATHSTYKSRPNNFNRYKHPRILSESKEFTNSKSDITSSEKHDNSELTSDSAKMVLNLNVFSESKIVLPKISTFMPPTIAKIETSSYNVPINNILPTNIPETSSFAPDAYNNNSNNFGLRIFNSSLPKVSTMYPIFETISPHYPKQNIWTTSQPEILKFSHEDAKIPDHYLQFGDRIQTTTETINIRRYSTDFVDTINNNDEIITPSNDEIRDLIAKLRNKLETTTKFVDTTTETSTIDTTEKPTTTTVQTYVPQINGHYRSLNQNSRNINNWLNGETETKSTRHLEISSATVTIKPYVEIQRKSSKSLESSDTF